jgi:hypothetical protein
MSVGVNSKPGLMSIVQCSWDEEGIGGVERRELEE